MNMKFLLTLIALSVATVTVQAQINWMTFEEAVEASAKEPRKIIVDVYTEWCGWCKRMDATTFEDPAVIKAINANFYAVKLNAEQREVILFKGKEYKFQSGGRRGSHELAQLLLQGRMGYPTVVFLDNQADVIQPVPGYQEPEAMRKIVDYFGRDVFRTTPWAEFSRAEDE